MGKLELRKIESRTETEEPEVVFKLPSKPARCDARKGIVELAGKWLPINLQTELSGKKLVDYSIPRGAPRDQVRE